MTKEKRINVFVGSPDMDAALRKLLADKIWQWDKQNSTSEYMFIPKIWSDDCYPQTLPTPCDGQFCINNQLIDECNLLFAVIIDGAGTPYVKDGKEFPCATLYEAYYHSRINKKNSYIFLNPDNVRKPHLDWINKNGMGLFWKGDSTAFRENIFEKICQILSTYTKAKGQLPLDRNASIVQLKPQTVWSATISPFHAFLCDLSDASRLAFAYAMASSEKRIDLYQDNKRQIYEYVIKHSFYGKGKFASFKLSSKEYQGLLKNIQDAEKQGFVAPNKEVLEYWQETEKQGFKRGAADDGGYVIQASCERRTLQSFIDDELRTEFAKFPPFALTILKIVCAEPNRTIQVDTNGDVHLLRGYHADNELAEPLFQKVSPKDLLNAISFLYNRGGFDKPTGNRNTPSGFYTPTPQSFLIDTLRRERLDKLSPFASSHNF